MIHAQISALDYFNILVKEKPDVPAVEDVATGYTFAQMEQAVGRVSGYLKQKIKHAYRQPSIAILLERNAEFVIAMFSIWRVGGYFVPLNVKWPKDRLQNILELCDHDIVITNSAFADISENAVTFDAILDSDESEMRFKPVKPSDIAYVIFTSGSTGTPKGVAISHESFRDYIGWTKRYFWEYRHNKKLLLTSELTFDITMGDIAFFLAFGTSIFVAPDPQNFLSIVNLLQKEKIDTFYSVPTTHRGVFGFLKLKPELAPECLNLVLSGGDVFSVELVKSIHAIVPKAHLYNVYGPTEVTINCYATRLDDKIDRLESVGKIPIGMPFDTIDSVLLDENDGVVTKPGRTGRLCVTGAQVMIGYLKDADLTKEKMVRDPRYPELERYLYDTGDLAVIEADGLTYLVGRTDDLTKIKGYRIHPDECSAVIRQIKRVKEAVVIVVTENQRNKLVGYIDGYDLSAGSIREHIKKHLPDYFIPEDFVFLSEMPLNQSGKIDKNALKQMYAVKTDG